MNRSLGLNTKNGGVDSRRDRRRGIWRWLGVAGLILLLIAGLVGRMVLNRVLPYAIIGSVRVRHDVLYPGLSPASLGLAAERFEVESEPGIRLVGWFVQAGGRQKGTVLLLHGHNNCKEAMLSLAKLLAQHGFNSLAYDSRGCGESGGRYCTYGYYEKRDCSRCLDELLRRYGAGVGPASIYGNSFGGAVALQVLAEDRRFRCGMVESTFATLREVVRDYEKNLSGVRLDTLTDAALNRGGVIAQFPPDEVRPEASAAQIQCPVLVVHGTVDADVAMRYGQRVFQHLRSPGSRWYPIKDADHLNLWAKGGGAYTRTFVDFLEEHGR